MEQRIKKYTPLLRELVKRDLKLKYRRSVLGYLWSLLNPLLMMTVMTVIFSYMFRYEIPYYPMYLICAQTLFSFFNESTNAAMYSVIQNGQLIRKIYIPKYIFPIAKVTSCYVTMSFSLVSILIVILFTGVPIKPTVLLFWLPLLLLFVFSCGIGLILSALAVQFRDITHLYSVLLTAWMYFTPIFYPISVLPDAVASIVKLNPLYIYITLFRELLLYGQIPEMSMWLVGIAISGLVLCLGLWVFKKMQKRFILYM